MANSLFPAFFRLFSTSQYAPHIATIPTTAWTAGSSGGAGSFEAWGGGPVDAAAMIEAYVDVLLPFYDADTEFNSAIIYTMDSPTDPARPRGFIAFTGKVGTSVAAAIPASMATLTFRTVTFGLLKIVMLDAPVTTDFLPVSVVTPATPLADLHDLLVDDANAFAGRDGGQPLGFVHATYKLNDELRKQYRLS